MTVRPMIVLAVLLASAVFPARAADYAWPIVRVIDGDTVAVDASVDLPPELADHKVRLRGVDTPEKGIGRSAPPSARLERRRRRSRGRRCRGPRESWCGIRTGASGADG